MKRVLLSLIALAAVAVSVPGTWAQTPVITSQPQNQKILPGATAVFAVEPNSAALTYQWERDGTNVVGGTNALLSLPNAQYFTHAGSYRVRVANGVNFVFSNPAALTFHGGLIDFSNKSPDLNAPVNNALTGQRLSSGGTFVAQLFAGTSANQLWPVTPTASFAFPGYFVGGSREIPWIAPGATAFFAVRAWDTANGSTYAQAVVNNGVTGSSPVFSALTGSALTSPPTPPRSLLGLQTFSVSPLLSITITGHPTNQTVVAGTATIFVVQANGSGTVHYQWRKNGANITGATNSTYTIPNTQSGDAAFYTVAVSDSAAITIISSGGQLSVVGFVQAQINAAAVGSTVTLPAGTYLERIIIDRNLTLRGAGAGNTTIDGEMTGTVLVVNANISVTVSNLTLRNASGAGVRNAGTLRLSACRIENNLGTGERGGGLLNQGEALIVNCSFSGNGNFDYPTFGGGIHNEAGATMNITSSTVTGNRAYGDGGIHNEGILNMDASAVHGNHGTFGGGGIGSYQGVIALVNSTLSGNDTLSDGGGLYNFATATLSSCTVVSNRAVNSGGGWWNQIGTITFKSTIVAGNSKSTSTPSDGVGSIISQGFNLFQTTNEIGITLKTGDLVNVNPLVGPLQDNGGGTLTHALTANSPAIDHGACGSLTVDQRGSSRLNQAGNGCDIGAYELSLVAPVTYAVNTSSVPANGGTTSGGGVYNSATSVTLLATANAGFGFLNWTENGSVVSSSASYVFSASGNRSLVANFTAVAGGGEVAFVTAVSASGARNNFSGAVGDKITIGAAPVTVTALGRFVLSGNSGAHLVRFVRATDKVEVASATINTAGAPAEQFRYTSLASPVVLAANTAYYLVSTEVAGGDSWYDYDRARLTTTPVGRCDSAVYTGAGLGWVEVGGAGQSYVPVDFKYSTGPVVTYAISTSSSPANGGTTSGGGTYNSGASVPLLATANAGFGFASWTESGSVVSTTPSYGFSAGSNRALVANFTNAPVTFTITTTASPVGSGTIAGGGSYASNASVTLIATANAGFSFSNWTENGSAVSSSASYGFNATAPRSLVANFTAVAGGAETAFVTGVTPSGVRNNFSGSVGDKITIGAAPVTVTALGRYVLAGNSGTHLVRLVRVSDKVDVATATVNTAGALAEQFRYAALASPVVLAANTSYYLVSTEVSGGDSWYDFDRTRLTTTSVGQCSAAVYTGAGLGWAEVGGAGQSYVPVDFKYSIGPVVTYAISTSSAPANGGTTSGGGTYNSGASVSLLATANAGFTFANWTEGGLVVSTSSSYVFNATGTRALVANFTNAPVGFTISTASLPANGGTTTGGGTYASNANVVVTAVPNSGFTFSSWSENGSVVSLNASYGFAVASNRTLSANFAAVAGGANTAFVTTVTPGGARNNFSGSVGLKFTVGSSPITATELGRYVLAGNSGSHLVRLVRISDKVEVASVAVDTGGAPANQFRYAPLSAPVVLGANTSYYLLSSEVSGGDTWLDYDRTRVTSTPVGQCNSAVYTGAGFGWVEVGGAGQSYVPVDFKYGSGGPVVTYAIATSSAPLNAGTTSGAGTFNSGASVTLLASANAGFAFANWTESGSVVSSSASYNFIATANRTLVANFSNGPVTFTISTASAPANGGATTGSGSYNSNAPVTVTALANAGFAFANWTQNGAVVSSSASYLFNIASNRSLVATFTNTPAGAEQAFITGLPTLGQLRSDGARAGMQITVGAAPLNITALARLCAPGNNRSHALRLIRASTGQDVAGAVVNVSMSGATPGQFVYANLPAPVTLLPNTSYFLVSDEDWYADAWYDAATTVTTTAAATCDGAGSFWYGWSMQGGANSCRGPVNFKYTSGGGAGGTGAGASVQEPRLEIAARAGQIDLIIRGRAGHDYRIESSLNLSDWTVVGDVHLESAVGSMTRAASEAREYFRVTELP